MNPEGVRERATQRDSMPTIAQVTAVVWPLRDEIPAQNDVSVER